MRGKTMKDKSKKSTYSTTFGVDPKNTAARTRGGGDDKTFSAQKAECAMTSEKRGAAGMRGNHKISADRVEI